MKITFEDGTSFDCSPVDTPQVSISQILIYPGTHIPMHFGRVWADPRHTPNSTR